MSVRSLVLSPTPQMPCTSWSREGLAAMDEPQLGRSQLEPNPSRAIPADSPLQRVLGVLQELEDEMRALS